MNLLIKRFIVLACICLSLGSASPAKKAVIPDHKQTMYYWYWTSTDTYHQYASIAQEESDATNYLNAWVDENPSGGTVVLKAYINNTFPHNFTAVKTLYVH